MALGWLWWRAWGPLVAQWRRGTLRGRRRLATSTVVLCGRRGTWQHLPSFCVAGGTYGTGLALVAHLGPFGRAVTPRPFAWQAWHLATSTGRFARQAFVLRGRHSFCFLFMITYLSRSPSSLNLGHSFDLGNLFLLLWLLSWMWIICVRYIFDPFLHLLWFFLFSLHPILGWGWL